MDIMMHQKKRNVHAKVRDKTKYPAKLKTQNGDLGKNGIPMDKIIKNSIQKLGIKAFDYIPMLSLSTFWISNWLSAWPQAASSQSNHHQQKQSFGAQCYRKWQPMLWLVEISHFHLICFFFQFLHISCLRNFASLYTLYMYNFSTINKMQLSFLQIFYILYFSAFCLQNNC